MEFLGEMVVEMVVMVEMVEMVVKEYIPHVRT